MLFSYSLRITRLLEEVRHQGFKVVLGWINEMKRLVGDHSDPYVNAE